METKVENGITYQKVTHPTIMVWTGPSELLGIFNGARIGRSQLDIQFDANGLPFIDQSVLDDPVWDAMATVPTGTYQGQLVRDLLTQIPYTYWEVIDGDI